MRLTKSLLFLILLISQSAHAGVLLEPYLGYGIGSGDRGNFDYSYNTPQYGARLGYQMLGVMGGIDYSMASFELEAENKTTGTTTKSDYKKNQLGVFVGYDFPLLVRAWGTYYVSANLEDDIAPISKYSGGGYALGVGFTPLPLVSLNVEYRTFSYDEVETGSTTASLDPNFDLNEIFLSVSLPLDL